MKNVGSIKHSSLPSRTEARCKGRISKPNWKINSYDLRMFWHRRSQDEHPGFAEGLLLYREEVSEVSKSMIWFRAGIEMHSPDRLPKEGR